MARRRRRARFWPLLVIVGVVALGLGVGNAITRPGGSAETSLRGEVEEAPTLDVDVPIPGDRIRVEVLNGGGISGVAARATELLRDRGFDVVYFGNESSFGRDSSVVLDRTRREGALEAVSGSLGIVTTQADPDASRLVDITVLLGADWEPNLGLVPDTVSVGPVGESEDGERPWWDPRRLFEGGS